MEELGTPSKLMDERMGHEDGSVQARYSHVTAPMRRSLMDGLTDAWAAALMLAGSWLLARRSRCWTACCGKTPEPMPKVFSPDSPQRARETVRPPAPDGVRRPVTCGYCGGRYWDRTSDPFGVNEVLSR